MLLCVQEAARESARYARYLQPFLNLLDVAKMVVSYCVSDYDLFQEALVRHHYDDCDMENILNDLENVDHPLTRRFLLELESVVKVKPHLLSKKCALRRILHVKEHQFFCYRLRCYVFGNFSMNGWSCMCKRTLQAFHIQDGLEMNYL